VSVVLRPLGIIVLPGVLQSGAATPAFLRLWAPERLCNGRYGMGLGGGDFWISQPDLGAVAAPPLLA
jgi:hypothetical protein